MVETIIWVSYLLICALSVRPMGGAMAWGMKPSYEDKPDTEDFIMSYMLASLMSFFWPLLVIGYITSKSPLFVSKTEKRGELKLRQKEIEKMERELGIR